MYSAVMMCRFPVAVTKMSAVSTTSSSVATWYPSIAAWSALIGSISVMITRARWPRSDSAQPLPTSPYPQTTATLPPISTSVARLMPSMSECRQPYLLSNLDLVTESLTLMAGNSSRPSRSMSYSRCTPVVVSSVTPMMSAPIRVNRSGSASKLARSRSRMTASSSGSSSVATGTAPACSYRAPWCTSSVASPPSSRSMFGPGWPGQVSAWSVHHQYSCSVSPFQAKTGMPLGSSGVPSGPTAIAAAAWSWVEKMLQLAHRTCAPSATSVSISTAVCTVMCSEPVMRAPRSGCVLAYSARTAIRPGISCSARVISLRPNSASERSATLNGIGSAGICAPVWNGLRFVIMGIWWSEQPISHDHYSWPGQGPASLVCDHGDVVVGTTSSP